MENHNENALKKIFCVAFLGSRGRLRRQHEKMPYFRNNRMLDGQSAKKDGQLQLNGFDRE